MIEFRTLGGLDVRGEDGQPVSAALSRPKPLALLVYLTLARPRGFHSQDALMALFWPDADTERARASLRQAVHVLRRTLGETTIQRRGRNELGLDATRVHCDVLAFEQALCEGRREEALALYRGDLLPAYFVPDAHDAEQWLEEERARLRALALDAARALTESASDSLVGAGWATRWAGIAPDDERPVRRALQLYEAAGDPPAAVRMFDAFAARQARADDRPPSATLQAMAERLRAATPPTPVAPIAVVPPTQLVTGPVERVAALPVAVEGADPTASGVPRIAPVSDTSNDTDPPASVQASPDQPERSTPGAAHDPPVAVPTLRRRAVRRWPMIAATVMGVAALVVGSAYIRRAPAARVVDADTPTSSDRRLVVLPFVVRGNSATGYLREAMVDLLSTKLDGVAGVTAVDPHTLFGAGTQESQDRADGVLDVARGAAAARRLGASQFVLGSVVEAGGRIEATAALYDVDGTRRATADAAGATEATLFTVADALARQLLDGVVRGPDVRLDRTATATTTSLPALKAFLEGEQRLRDGQRDAAAEAYERALAADSTFALAAYRLSTTAYSSAIVRAATEQARRHADRLPRAERLLVRGNSASDAGRVDEAEGLYRAALVVAPDMSEVLRRIGELRFHSGPWLGRPFTTAQDPFERELAVDPRDVNARVHLARIAAATGRAAAADSIAADALRLNPEPGVALELRTLRAAVTGGRDGVRGVLPLVRAAVGRPTTYDDDDAWLVAWRVATYADDPAAGSLLASVLTESGVPPHLQLLGYSAAAHLEAARGRWGVAEAQLAAAAAIDSLRAADVRANLATLALVAFGAPGGSGSSGGVADGGWVARARDGLLRLHIPDRPTTEDAGADPNGQQLDVFRAVRRPYFLGVLALAAGDTAESARQLRALAPASHATGTAGIVATHLAHQLAARLRWSQGDAAGALRLVEQGWPVAAPTDSRTFHGDTYTQAAERVFRGDLLRALGRDREALAWYESATEEFGATLALSAPVHLRRAAVLERLGDRGGAAAQYARAAALWADADPALQPAARAARARAAAPGR